MAEIEPTPENIARARTLAAQADADADEEQAIADALRAYADDHDRIAQNCRVSAEAYRRWLAGVEQV